MYLNNKLEDTSRHTVNNSTINTKLKNKAFPGDLVAKTALSMQGGHGLIPRQGTRFHVPQLEPHPGK